MNSKKIYKIVNIVLFIYCLLYIPIFRLVERYVRNNYNHEENVFNTKTFSIVDSIFNVIVFSCVIIKIIAKKKMNEKIFKSIDGLFILLLVIVFILRMVMLFQYS